METHSDADANENGQKKSTNALTEYAKTNPTAAGLLLGGVAAFTAVATVVGFGLDVESNVPSVVYLILIGLALYIVSSLLNDADINRIIRWAVLLVLLLWSGAFFLQRLNPRWEELACAVYFWTPCKVVADRASQDPPRQGSLAPPTAASPGSALPSTNPVFVQFAGLDRDDVRNAMRDLAAKGWKVQGIERGGQRTPAAAGKDEVRYFGASDQQAGAQLARDVASTGLVTQNIKAVQNSLVKPGTFEIWVGG